MFDELVNFYDDFTKNERTQSLSRLAIENNLPFLKRESFGNQSTDLRSFQIFKKKGVKRFLGIINIDLHDSDMGSIRFYDYLVTKDLETKTTSIIEVYIPEIDTNQFKISPKSGISRLLKFRRKKKLIDLYERQFKSDLNIKLSEDQMEILLDHPKFTVEGDGSIFLFYRKNKQIDIPDLFPIIDFVENFVLDFNNSSSEDFV